MCGIGGLHECVQLPNYLRHRSLPLHRPHIHLGFEMRIIATDDKMGEVEVVCVCVCVCGRDALGMGRREKQSEGRDQIRQMVSKNSVSTERLCSRALPEYCPQGMRGLDGDLILYHYYYFVSYFTLCALAMYVCHAVRAVSIVNFES